MSCFLGATESLSEQWVKRLAISPLPERNVHAWLDNGGRNGEDDVRRSETGSGRGRAPSLYMGWELERQFGAT